MTGSAWTAHRPAVVAAVPVLRPSCPARAAGRAGKVLSALLTLALCSSCATTPRPGPDEGAPGDSAQAPAPAAQVPVATPVQSGLFDNEDPPPIALPADEPSPQRSESVIVRGTGRFIDESAASKPRYYTTPSGEVALEFDGIEVREVVRTILGDLLQENYVIDDKVSGKVTLNTSSPLSKDALLAVLESVLALNGAAMLREDGLYKVVPTPAAAVASIAPRLRPQDEAGFQTVVVPLRYIAVDDMLRILSGMRSGGGKDAGISGVQADKRRNLLIASGTAAELRQLLDTVAVFDVDQFAGMSVGLFRLSVLDAEQMVNELQELVTADETSPLFNMVRFMPVQRINSVLVVSSQPRYLTYIEEWIERLDRTDLVSGLGLHVYRVKNRDAARLAEVLQALYVGEEPATERRAGVAPGLERRVARVEGAKALPRVGTSKLQRQLSGGTVAQAEVEVGPAAMAGGTAEVGQVRIIADEDNNTLIVMASAEDYAKVEATIRRLDVRPLQVLIEATIISVGLDGSLRYGVEWFFKNNNVFGEPEYTGIGQLDIGSPGIGLAQGFSYAVIDSVSDVRFVVNLLERESTVNVLSSPSLMVLDNNTASIRVGNQVPVITESAATEGGTIIESVQFKDTGVLLTVKPRVNEGGLVSLEVSQEVTDAGAIDPATGQRQFLQRTIDSTVAVQNGQTVVLGGLITENQTEAEEGVPGIKDVPVIGWLFKSKDKQSSRTELLVLLTPRVVQSDAQMQGVLDEMRGRMRGLDWEFYDSFRTPPTEGEGSDGAEPAGEAGAPAQEAGR